MNSLVPPPTKPTKKTAYHHGDLRASIIDAVAQLIGNKKSLSFHLKDVAQLVGTSQPAIYKHFEGKSALLVETAIKGYKLQNQFRDHAMSRTNGSPLAKLLAIGFAYVNFSRMYPGYFLLMKNLETEEILSSKRYIAEQNHILRLVTNLIQDCVDDGAFVKIDTEFAMTVLQSSAYGLAHLYITGQIDRIASKHAHNDDFLQKVLAKSIESLLSPKGKKQLSTLQMHGRN